MESFADREIRVSLSRMVGDHQKAAGLERGKQLPIHLGAIHVQVGRIVIEEQIRDHVEVMNVTRQWIIVRSHESDAVFHCGGGGSRREGIPCTLKIIGWILTVDYAGRSNDARRELGAVAGAGSHIEHLHARLQPSELKERHRISALVGRTVRIAAVRRRHEGRIVGRALCRCVPGAKAVDTDSKDYSCTYAGSTPEGREQSDHFRSPLTTKT